MSDEWLHSTIGEVAEVVGGGTPSTKEPAYWGGDIPWLTPTEVVRADGKTIASSDRTITSLGLAKSSANLLPTGAVLLTTRASVGFTAVAAAPLATNQGFQSLIPGDDLLPAFLMLWIQANREEIRSRAGGSTFPEVSKVKVRQIPITVPPLEVQRRIVELVGAMDANCDALVAECESAECVFDALKEDLTATGQAVKVRDLAHQPRGLVGGPFGSSLTAKDYVEAGVPVIRGTNMPKVGKWVGGDFVYVSERKAASLRSNSAQPGDVIFTQRGTLGQVGIVPAAEYDQYVVSQSQMRLRVDPGSTLADFIFYTFSKPSMVAHIQSLNTATANPHINLGILGEVQIMLPSLDEQRRVCDVLGAVARAGASVQSELAALRSLRSRTLNALLSGEIEIPESYDRLQLDAGVSA